MKRAVIYVKCIVVETDETAFYRDVANALEALEDAAQSYGWGEVKVTDDGELPQFDTPPNDYR